MSRRRSSVVEVDRSKDGILRVNDDAMRRMSQLHDNVGKEISDAKAASNAEKSLSVRDSVRLYKKAICFSLIMSLAVIMEGYDLSLMGSFMGYSQFQARYGTETDPITGEPIISAAWQSGLQNGVQVGSIIGLYLNGIVSEAIGYRKTMMGSLVLMVAFIFLPFFAPNVQTILAGAILSGIPWGVFSRIWQMNIRIEYDCMSTNLRERNSLLIFYDNKQSDHASRDACLHMSCDHGSNFFQTLTVTYASEVTPTNIRAYLTTYVNLCWVFGQLIAAGVLRGCSTLDNEWAYRIPFAIQWVWPIPIFIGVVLAPESPWWLVRKGKYDEARKALQGLTSPTPSLPFDVDAQVAMIKATNEFEMSISEGTSYLDCFRGTDLRRTEIASMAWVAQAFCGAALMGYSVQFYQYAGMDESNALNMNIGQYAMGAVGTVGSWFLMKHIGRRALYFYGLATLCGILIIVGSLGFISNGNSSAQWAIGSLLLLYTFFYDITVGPVCYSLVSEIPSTRLKIKTVVLARNFYNIGGIINNIIMPRMLGPREWNWGARTGLFWAGACAILLVWTYFRLPEPKDRTYGELDVLFENKVSARRFHKTSVDQFSGNHTEIVQDDTSSDGEKTAVEHRV